MKNKILLIVLLLFVSELQARVKCFQNGKTVNMNHGGVIKKLNGEVVCKRNDKIQRKEFIEKGIRKKTQFFHRNGKLKSEQNFNTKKKRHGKSLSYFDNGKLEREEIYENGNEIGPELYYFKSGKLKKKTYFHNRRKSSFEYTVDEGC